MNMLKRNKRNSHGFTLVELIVVLVILAILIALLVPALTGYIDKANKKAAIAECRQVVVAAQSTADELYGKGEFTLAKMNGLQDDILKLAEVDGRLDNWSFDEKATVDTLVYTTKKNITVIYENKTYTVSDTASMMGSAKGLTQLSKILHNTKDMTVDKTKPDLNNTSRLLQNYLMQENNGKLPGLNAKEKELYSKLGLSNIDPDTVVWKPVYDTKGNIFLVADSKKTSELGAAYGAVIYADGKYYAHKNGNKYTDKWISDQGAELNLDDEKEWEEVSL